MLQNAPLLRLVKDEIDSTIHHAEVRLKAYSEGASDALIECAEDFNQVSGACKMIKLPAAEMLAGELSAFIVWMKGLSEDDANLDIGISSLTVGITMLSRYLDYIDTNGGYFPELVLPIINEIRLARGKQACSDSFFFSFDRDHLRAPLRSFVNKPAMTLPGVKDLRRLRHMYQVGLLEIIRNNEGGFRLMKRSLERIEAICGDTKVAEIWPLAQLSIEAMVMGDVELTRSRKLLFAWLDRELRQLSVDGATYLASEPSAELIKELCYIIAVSTPVSENIKIAKRSLELSSDIPSDATLRTERSVMLGPDSTVIQAVSIAVSEELAKIKDAIDVHCRSLGENHHDEILELLESIEKTLHLLELDDLCGEVHAQLKHLRNLSKEELNDREIAYGPLIGLVLRVEAVMSLMLKGRRLSDVIVNTTDTKKSPLGLLEEIRFLTIVESRAGLALAKRSLSSFIDSGWDLLHLGNVPDSLHDVWGALYFLDLPRVANITLNIQHYIEQRLLSGTPDTPTENDLEALADAVTGLDYYLESIERDKPLGVGVLEVAEESLEALGFIVDETVNS